VGSKSMGQGHSQIVGGSRVDYKLVLGRFFLGMPLPPRCTQELYPKPNY